MMLKKMLVRIISVIAVALLCATVIMAQEITIKEVKEYKFISKDQYFTFEDFSHPKLKELVKKENLAEVVKKGTTDFEKILLLKKWVRKQLKQPGVSTNYPPWDALVILDWARKNKVQVMCGHYAVLFVQCLTGLGIPARYVDLSTEKNDGHFVAEVWSQDFQKWVLIDPYFDLYYEKEGIPLSGLSLHLAYINKDFKGIEKVSAQKIQDITNEDDLKVFYNYTIVLRNNHISQPVNLFDLVVKVTPSIMVTHMWDDVRVKYEGLMNRSLFYWAPNICVITVKEKDPKAGTIILNFKTLVESTEKFLVICSGRYTISGPDYLWQLEKGFNELNVTPLMSSYSSQSYISAEYK
jgi:hypothetical protein